VRTILVDAGPLMALFAGDDRHPAHDRDLIVESAVTGPRFATTWPCAVEASYLLATTQRLAMLACVEKGGVQVFPFDVGHLGAMRGRMRRYSDPGPREMDLAAASLFWLAAQTGITDIMTVDHAYLVGVIMPAFSTFCCSARI
jgi:predicted nucleic acid-binding protein